MKTTLLDIQLDRTLCLHRQLIDAIAAAVRGGSLPAGCRLPSTRSLARHLGVSRNTVMNAYEELAAAGWIAGRIGSGTRVAGSTPRPPRLETHRLLALAHYPATSASFYDPEGNCLHLQG